MYEMQRLLNLAKHTAIDIDQNLNNLQTLLKKTSSMMEQDTEA